MKSANVYYNAKLAGVISQSPGGYIFQYDPIYLSDPTSKPVSLTLPLRTDPYFSEMLFPAFVNKLSEGSNKAMQTRLLKIDEQDYFGLLLATSGNDNIGPITIKENNESTGN